MDEKEKKGDLTVREAGRIGGKKGGQTTRERYGRPFYEQIGRTNYQLVASHATARRCELNDVFEELADRFREVRLALNRLSEQLLNLDDDARPSLCL